MNYETGVMIGLIFWLYFAVMIIVNANSQLDKNLRRMGMRISWLTGSSKPLSVEARDRTLWKNILKYLFLIGTSLPFVLLSWLYVAYAVGTMLWNWSKAQGTPQVIKEGRWKLRNIDMDFDSLVRETLKISNRPAADFEKVRAETIADLEERGLR